jgi:hypothetical protein
VTLSSSPTEILERNPTQFETSLRNIKDQHENLSPAKDCNLRTGDSFRLRSVKFPEYEMGVTSVKLKDEFCYVGLRKVRLFMTSLLNTFLTSCHTCLKSCRYLSFNKCLKSYRSITQLTTAKQEKNGACLFDFP